VAPLDTRVDAPRIEAPELEARADDLTKVRGIGAKFSAALEAGGITSFAELAEADEAKLRGIVRAPEWRRVDYSDWILQAQILSDLPPAPVTAGDDLTIIEGIGPKYAGLLREAGIDTFAGLTAKDEVQLRAVINAPAWRRVDYPMWIEQARLIVTGNDEALAELQDRLHRRSGDNLALIAGIGEKAKQTLISAGISSYADLAAADEERLGLIFDRAGLRGGDYAAWKEEAKTRAAGKRVRRGETVAA
jgi:predicted flap endonuclease-1-like 5' DNA nuclease